MLSRDIEIPHLNYTVRVRPYRKAPVGFEGAQAFTQRTSQWSSTIHLKRNASPAIIAHEIVHVLQNLCRDRHMEFTIESEHMAYLMQYLMMTIDGGCWYRPKRT